MSSVAARIAELKQKEAAAAQAKIAQAQRPVSTRVPSFKQPNNNAPPAAAVASVAVASVAPIPQPKLVAVVQQQDSALKQPVYSPLSIGTTNNNSGSLKPNSSGFFGAKPAETSPLGTTAAVTESAAVAQNGAQEKRASDLGAAKQAPVELLPQQRTSDLGVKQAEKRPSQVSAGNAAIAATATEKRNSDLKPVDETLEELKRLKERKEEERRKDDALDTHTRLELLRKEVSLDTSKVAPPGDTSAQLSLLRKSLEEEKKEEEVLDIPPPPPVEEEPLPPPEPERKATSNTRSIRFAEVLHEEFPEEMFEEEELVEEEEAMRMQSEEPSQANAEKPRRASLSQRVVGVLKSSLKGKKKSNA